MTAPMYQLQQLIANNYLLPQLTLLVQSFPLHMNGFPMALQKDP